MAKPDDRGEGRVARTVIWIFVSGLLATVIGFLLSILGANSDVLVKYSDVFKMFVGSVLALFVLAMLYQLISDLRDEARKLRETAIRAENASRLSNNVSTLVTFVDRRENILVRNDGSGVFECTYVVAYSPQPGAAHNGVVKHLHFPVILDIPDEQSSSGRNVTLHSLKVDGQAVPVADAYVPQELRRRLALRPDGVAPLPQEYGFITAPVSLSASNRQHRIEILIEYKDIFNAHRTGDYIVVDIPYLTRDLLVRVRAEDKACAVRPQVKGPLLCAIGEMMDLQDDFEGESQASAIVQAGKTLEWRTSSAKIGYRYMIQFRIVPVNGQ